MIQTLTIVFTNVQDENEELLLFEQPPSLELTVVEETDTVIFTNDGTATNADFQQVLDSLTYENLSSTPDLTQRELTFVVNDGELDSNVATTFVSFDGDAAAPVVVNNSSGVVDEGAALTITNNELQFSDLQGASSINYLVTTAPTSGFLALSSAETTPISSFTQEDIDLRNLIYVHNGTETTSDQFTFTVRDGQGNADSGQFDIVVNPVNDAPNAGGF